MLKTKFIGIEEYLAAKKMTKSELFQAAELGEVNLLLNLEKVMGGISGFEVVEVNGLCRLNVNHINRIRANGNFKDILLNAPLVICEGKYKIRSSGWEEVFVKPKENELIFNPCEYISKDEAANPRYAMKPNNKQTDGKVTKKSYCYSIPVKHIQVEERENYINWRKFYTGKNANIVESVLKVGTIKLGKLIEIFFPRLVKFPSDEEILLEETNTHEKIIAYFNEVIVEYKQNYPDADVFNWIVADPEYKGGTISKNTLLMVEKAISILIQGKFLPKELTRLPRLSPQEVGFNIINSYYENYEECKLIEDPNILINHPSNYFEKPAIFNYDTVKKRWAELGLPDNQIELCCINNQIGAYLMVPESTLKVHPESINLSEQKQLVFTVFYRNSHLSLFLERNCGNPFYLKRYVGLERLKVEDDHNFDLKTLFSNRLLVIKASITSTMQTTDLETKYHIDRRISGIISADTKQVTKIIDLNDLVFLQEEVLAMEKKFSDANEDLNFISKKGKDILSQNININCNIGAIENSNISSFQSSISSNSSEKGFLERWAINMKSIVIILVCLGGIFLGVESLEAGKWSEHLIEMIKLIVNDK